MAKKWEGEAFVSSRQMLAEYCRKRLWAPPGYAPSIGLWNLWPPPQDDGSFIVACLLFDSHPDFAVLEVYWAQGGGPHMWLASWPGSQSRHIAQRHLGSTVSSCNILMRQWLCLSGVKKKLIRQGKVETGKGTVPKYKPPLFRISGQKSVSKLVHN